MVFGFLKKKKEEDFPELNEGTENIDLGLPNSELPNTGKEFEIPAPSAPPQPPKPQFGFEPSPKRIEPKPPVYPQPIPQDRVTYLLEEIMKRLDNIEKRLAFIEGALSREYRRYY